MFVKYLSRYKKVVKPHLLMSNDTFIYPHDRFCTGSLKLKNTFQPMLCPIHLSFIENI